VGPADPPPAAPTGSPPADTAHAEGAGGEPGISLPSLPAFRILQEAIRAVPPVRYALGVAGVIAVLAITLWMGVDLRVAALGAPVLFVLMVVLVVFRRVATHAHANLELPAIVLIWASLLVTIAVVVLLLTSVFFRKPMDLQQFIIHEPARASADSAAGAGGGGDAGADQIAVQAALAQAKAGDFESGWKALTQRAQSNPNSPSLKETQARLAMMWLRDIHALGENHSLTEYVDPLLPCLNERAVTAKGSEAADALAHIGWGYYLKYREGETHLAVDEQFRHALELDPSNPFAHVMWGYWILWRHGPLAEAQAHFAAALASGRERTFVRHLEFSAFVNGAVTDDPDCAVALIRMGDEMRKSNESLPVEERARAISYVYWGSVGDALLLRLDSILPPADHLATFHWLVDGAGKDDSTITGFWLARLTEATGDYAAAMPMYVALRSRPFTFRAEIEKGIARCARHNVAVPPGPKKNA
jgi:hypothetical protein